MCFPDNEFILRPLLGPPCWVPLNLLTYPEEQIEGVEQAAQALDRIFSGHGEPKRGEPPSFHHILNHSAREQPPRSAKVVGRTGDTSPPSSPHPAHCTPASPLSGQPHVGFLPDVTYSSESNDSLNLPPKLQLGYRGTCWREKGVRSQQKRRPPRDTPTSDETEAQCKVSPRSKRPPFGLVSLAPRIEKGRNQLYPPGASQVALESPPKSSVPQRPSAPLYSRPRSLLNFSWSPSRRLGFPGENVRNEVGSPRNAVGTGWRKAAPRQLCTPVGVRFGSVRSVRFGSVRSVSPRRDPALPPTHRLPREHKAQRGHGPRGASARPLQEAGVSAGCGARGSPQRVPEGQPSPRAGKERPSQGCLSFRAATHPRRWAGRPGRWGGGVGGPPRRLIGGRDVTPRAERRQAGEGGVLLSLLLAPPGKKKKKREGWG